MESTLHPCSVLGRLRGPGMTQEDTGHIFPLTLGWGDTSCHLGCFGVLAVTHQAEELLKENPGSLRF